MVLPVDKGNVAVIMDVDSYGENQDNVARCQGVREAEALTAMYKERLVSLLLGFKEQGKITLHQYNVLYPTSNMIPQLYDSP